MKKFKDLDLVAIRDKHNLDFAAYTYKKGQCSCCYGPLDLKASDWSEQAFKRAGVNTLSALKRLKDFDYTYILFKNADNGSGVVTGDDYLSSSECIEWNFDEALLDNVCADLQEQVGDEYLVVKPESKRKTIMIYEKDTWSYYEYLKKLEEQNAVK